MEAYVAWLGGKGSVKMSKAKQHLTHLGHIGSASEGNRVEGLGQDSKLRFRRHAALYENRSETQPCCYRNVAKVTG